MSSLKHRIETRLRERIEAAEKSSPNPSGKLDLGPLFAKLDELIEVIEGVQDFSIEPYMDRVRQVVCAACRQDETGRCATRDNARCGLDQHFDLIVAVVEHELRRDPGLPQAG